MDREKRPHVPPKRDYDTPRFIRLVFEHNLLWNIEHKDYHNNDLRENAWKAISKRFFNIGSETCKAAWNTLRVTRSNNRRRKAERTRSGIPYKRKPPKFKYEDEMSFLDGVKQKEVQESNFGTISNTKDDDDDGPVIADEGNASSSDSSADGDDIGDDLDVKIAGKTMSAMDYSIFTQMHDVKDCMRGPLATIQPPSTHSTPLQNQSFGKLEKITNKENINPGNTHLHSDEEHKNDNENVHQDNFEPKKGHGPVPKKRRARQQKDKNEKVVPRKKEKKVIFSSEDEEFVDEDGLELDRNIEEKIAFHDLKRKRQERRKEAIENKVLQRTNDAKSKALTLAIMEDLRRNNSEEDPWTLSCMSLASRMQKLRPEVASVLNIKFSQLIHEAEAGELLAIHNKRDHMESNDEHNSKDWVLMETHHLTAERNDYIRESLQKPDKAVITSNFGLTILAVDLKSLKPEGWLNDNIINFYLNLVVESANRQDLFRAYLFSTFFIGTFTSKGFDGVRMWTKKVHLFSYDMLLIPVLEVDHWTLLIVRIPERTVQYYNSLSDRKSPVVQDCIKYLQSHGEDSFAEWEEEVLLDTPRQENGYDCGVFICKFAQTKALDLKESFSQGDINRIRQEMIYEILIGDLFEQMPIN